MTQSIGQKPNTGALAQQKETTTQSIDQKSNTGALEQDTTAQKSLVVQGRQADQLGHNLPVKEPGPGRLLSTTMFGTPEQIQIQGATGSQGSACIANLAESLRNSGLIDKTELIAIARNPSAFHKISVKQDANLLRMSDLPIQVRKSAGGPTSSTLVVNMASGGGLKDTLDTLPAGTQVMLTQNGIQNPDAIPPHLKTVQAVSKFITKQVTGPDGTLTTMNVPGAIQMSKSDPVAQYLEKLLAGGPLTIEFVDDISKTQWTKIGLNTTLNSLCAIFNKDKGELFAIAQTDPRMRQLINGVVREVCSVAQSQGVPLKEDIVHSGINKTVDQTPQHRTSMGNNFIEGKQLETAQLSGGVNRLAREASVAAPLCNYMTQILDGYVHARDQIAKESGSPPMAAQKFIERYADEIRKAQDNLLNLAARMAPPQQAAAIVSTEPV